MSDLDSEQKSTPVIGRHRKLTRRNFIKAAGLALGAAWAAKEAPGIVLDTSLTATHEAMDTHVPDEFKDTRLPTKNEYYRPPEEILRQAFDVYNSRRGEKSLPPITFIPRRNYLDSFSLASRMRRAFGKSEYFDGKLDTQLAQIVFAPTEQIEIEARVNGEIYAFSAFSLDGVLDLLGSDPGSGIVGSVIDNLVKEKGWTRRQFYEMAYDGKINDEDLQICQERISKSLLQAKRYFQSERAKQTEPLSCSAAIVYFLSQNRGDLYKSMWDTTLFLKMIVRNDLTSLRVSVSYEQAVDIAYLFKDEFSPHMSHNWLMGKFQSGLVLPNSPLYLHGAMENQQAKDFMPTNRDGVYYHCLNLMTWASVCMDPNIAKTIVLTYYNEEKIGGMDRKPEHGKEKVTADILTVQHADQIKRTARRYT